MIFLKKLVALVTAVLLLITGCSAGAKTSSKYSKYTYEFLGAFDTMIQFMGYAENEKQFEDMSRKGQTRFEELHKLYDIYNTYEGINNVKTINDNAGIKPVEVKQELIDVILFSKDWYKKTGSKINIALGPVLSIWHDYREKGKENPAEAKLPDLEILKRAALKTDLDKVAIDTAKRTVFLSEAGMRLDLGAVAKGYATELVAKELMKAGYTSFIINSGGNVRVVGAPRDGTRSKWGIGIQDPNTSTGIHSDTNLETVFMTDASLVTSGDYQRYYEVNGQRIHHIIDPVTLMPPYYYRSVTIMTKDSGVADFIDTAAFILPYEQSRALIESIEGIDALWVMPDGSIRVTDNMKKMLKNLGGASSK
ncbi:MAG: FAD:protein FMN transferase [Clostridia bacterium]|nr:FAD:protein FMN transferase [Clostridia bacterium]